MSLSLNTNSLTVVNKFCLPSSNQLITKFEIRLQIQSQHDEKLWKQVCIMLFVANLTNILMSLNIEIIQFLNMFCYGFVFYKHFPSYFNLILSKNLGHRDFAQVTMYGVRSHHKQPLKGPFTSR